MKITPILLVDEIEPSLAFWVDRLGFSKTVEVPEGEKLGFVILQHENAELMLQTRSSAKADSPAMMEGQPQIAFIYIEVEDFDDVLERAKGIAPLIPIRTTFYGMKELWLREPGGNTVGFAARAT